MGDVGRMLGAYDSLDVCFLHDRFIFPPFHHHLYHHHRHHHHVFTTLHHDHYHDYTQVNFILLFLIPYTWNVRYDF